MTLPKGFGTGRPPKSTYPPRKPDFKKKKTGECKKCFHHKRYHKKILGLITTHCKICMCPQYEEKYNEVQEF